MNRSTRAIAQIGLALVLSLVAAMLIFRWMNKQAAKTTRIKTSTVVVAKSELGKGSKITPEVLAVRKYPVDAVPSGHVSDPESLKDRVLAVAVGANEPITRIKLVSDKAVGGISSLVAPGKRAMSVKGNAVMGLAGFVHPGDRVDVLVSMTEGEKENPVTKVVLEWVKVLATGNQLDSPTEEGSTASVDVYTLELSPKESERLALAATRGTLHFALRNAVDNATVYTTGATPRSTLSAFRPYSKPGTRARRTSVEVISGSTRTKKSF